MVTRKKTRGFGERVTISKGPVSSVSDSFTIRIEVVLDDLHERKVFTDASEDDMWQMFSQICHDYGASPVGVTFWNDGCAWKPVDEDGMVKQNAD